MNVSRAASHNGISLIFQQASIAFIYVRPGRVDKMNRQRPADSMPTVATAANDVDRCTVGRFYQSYYRLLNHRRHGPSATHDDDAVSTRPSRRAPISAFSDYTTLSKFLFSVVRNRREMFLTRSSHLSSHFCKRSCDAMCHRLSIIIIIIIITMRISGTSRFLSQ